MPISFIVAGLFVLIGILGLVLGLMLYSSLPAPSVQGDGIGTNMGCWFAFWVVLAVIAFASHWAHWPSFTW